MSRASKLGDRSAGLMPRTRGRNVMDVTACDRRLGSITVMSLEATRDLSIPDLLCLLNEKLGLECTRLQETPLPPLAATASLESEVSVPDRSPSQQAWLWDLTVNPSDRESRSQSARCPRISALFAEHVAAGQQVTTRDHHSYRPTHPPRQRRYISHYFDDSRMPILAPVHHLDPRKLDIDIFLPNGPDSVDPGAVQGGPSAAPA